MLIHSTITPEKDWKIVKENPWARIFLLLFLLAGTGFFAALTLAPKIPFAAKFVTGFFFLLNGLLSWAVGLSIQKLFLQPHALLILTSRGLIFPLEKQNSDKKSWEPSGFAEIFWEDIAWCGKRIEKRLAYANEYQSERVHETHTFLDLALKSPMSLDQGKGLNRSAQMVPEADNLIRVIWTNRFSCLHPGIEKVLRQLQAASVSRRENQIKKWESATTLNEEEVKKRAGEMLQAGDKIAAIALLRARLKWSYEDANTFLKKN